MGMWPKIAKFCCVFKTQAIDRAYADGHSGVSGKIRT